MIKFLIKNSTEVCKNPSADQSTQRYRHRLKTEKLAALLTGAHFAGWLARSRPQVCVCVCLWLRWASIFTSCCRGALCICIVCIKSCSLSYIFRQNSERYLQKVKLRKQILEMLESAALSSSFSSWLFTCCVTYVIRLKQITKCDLL